MITRRILFNLLAFGLVSTALVVYGFFDVLGNPFSHRTTVSTVLPSAAGLVPEFDVTLHGVVVGTVSSVSLVGNGVRITMVLNPGVKVPSDVGARVAITNALGQQEVQLIPEGSTSTGDTTDANGHLVTTSGSASEAVSSLRNGAVIPPAPDSEPAEVGTVVAETTRLLQAIPPGSLDQLLHEAAVALDHNVGNLKTIVSASELFSEEFLAQQQQFESLLQNAPPVLDAVNANASAFQQGLADTAVIVQTIADHADDLARLFSQGSGTASTLEALMTQNEPNLACIVHDSADATSDLGRAPNLENLSTALSTNQLVFGAVRRLAVTGPAKALDSNDPTRTDQEWLRTRLLIPPLKVPVAPQPMEYATPTSLPPVLPGAGCDTEFGDGVGAVSQTGFHPAGPNARVVAPTPAEAQVRGGGTEPAPSSPAAVRLPSQSASPVPLFLLGGLVVLGWLITMGHGHVMRSARPLREVTRRAGKR